MLYLLKIANRSNAKAFLRLRFSYTCYPKPNRDGSRIFRGEGWGANFQYIFTPVLWSVRIQIYRHT